MKLFQSYNLGGLRLPNRVVMAPLTRSRAPENIADDMTAIYYGQRATAGLIIADRASFYGGGAAGYIDYPVYGGATDSIANGPDEAG